jgi:hypothetical protein
MQMSNRLGWKALDGDKLRLKTYMTEQDISPSEEKLDPTWS